MIDDLITSDLQNFVIDVAGHIHCTQCRGRVPANDDAVGRTILDLTKACTQHVCE
jgi:hypothetical protein